MRETAVGRIGARERRCLVERRGCSQTCPVVEERVVGNLEEPRAEAASVLLACTGEVGLHQRVLRQVVGIALIAAAEGELEAAKGLLLTIYQGD